MKKIIALFILAVTFASCGEEIKFNSPAFQANKNGNIWKANDMTAFSDAGGLTVIAAVGTEIVTLHTASANPGTYTLGVNNVNAATYESVDGEGALFATGTGVGSGKIIITPNQATGTISGNFQFVGEDEEGNEVIFTEGTFYKVPR
ncbi:hypothetical protein FCR2A7T_01470 [Flavobacterium cauense R2A-7]|uniref:Uncharacterized protein n=1 Tax=Flavobacterium cauense R2A-7 TaxID=1341154 RepID=V6S620_9FLAO|nr:DUF6252 family protein [Flavobacterium cauense]ESU21692.1 hypothetical protein FCR2A7T_01470 [Flavobacterium cauense R2A-7]KGO80929.1 hypothetical protein Q762_09785 [Flavobacterium cauense R2A-7]TWI12838.1 hypothetical protein IP98_01312 [Flavobacterium cauense R2A-7]